MTLTSLCFTVLFELARLVFLWSRLRVWTHTHHTRFLFYWRLGLGETTDISTQETWRMLLYGVARGKIIAIDPEPREPILVLLLSTGSLSSSSSVCRSAKDLYKAQVMGWRGTNGEFEYRWSKRKILVLQHSLTRFISELCELNKCRQVETPIAEFSLSKA